MFISIIILICTTALHWFLQIRRNITRKKFGSRAEISYQNGATEVIISAARPFKAQSGQYIYVWIPGIYAWPFPHSITWWDNGGNGRGKDISLLVDRESDLAKALSKYGTKNHFAWVDGPYGISTKIDKYDDMLMVATGMGIAAQIPYIRDFLDACSQQPAAYPSIYIAWQVNDLSELDWVKTWMDKLLEQDTGSYILRFGLYLPKGESKGEPEADGKHKRIWKIYSPMEPLKIISKDFWSRKGKKLVTVAANAHIRDGIRDLVQQNMVEEVKILNLGFKDDGEYIKRQPSLNTVA
ncbi:hypothetical protein TMEN_6619 [Trichophyton mentagrophytes]|nr:hypothetical protein TMEN_6619 [Trichophyton mentagrophytes]